jgi:hypothetical protein
MKFCPECGTLLDGATECNICGFNKKEYEENPKDNKVNNEFLFTEPGFRGMNFQVPEPKIDHVVELKDLQNDKIELDELESIKFESSGGMSGGLSYTSIDLNDKLLETCIQNHYSSPTEFKKYKVSSKDINKIKEMIEKYNFPAWSKIDVDKTFIAYDAPSRNFVLTYKNKSFRMSYNIYMTDEERKIFYDFRDFIGSLLKEENSIFWKKYDSEYNPMYMGFMPTNQNIKGNKVTYYCVKCKKELKEGIFECECGYKVPMEYENK